MNNQNPSNLFYFDTEKLDALAQDLHSKYTQAEPFPHIVIDNFMSEPALEAVLKEFPKPHMPVWRTYDKEQKEKKLSLEDDVSMGDTTRHILSQFNAATFVNFLEKLTGIQGLIPDPHFRGGGLHQIIPGGYLGIHADFNRYKRLNLYRRINAIVYLNKDWKEAYGGHLELWSKDMSHAVHKIAPLFNRCVIFNTSDFAYHGHPDPLKCPEGMSRKSMALYYYTSDHSGKESVVPHTTLFQSRPGEKATKSAKRFIPPVVLDFWRAMKRRK